MGVKRSSRACSDWKICAEVFVGFILIWGATNSFAATNPVDVAAINRLFSALGFPQLPGWVQSGGDPCLEVWQGVQCIASDIITIILNGANLGGELGDSLSEFASITVLDLSNNHIGGVGGSIPPNLPVTLKNLFLSANQFSGSIPSSVATLTLLTDMSLNNNLLSGEIPDAFEPLTGLINLDLSNNSLSGQLPPNPIFHSRMKHVAIDFHFIRDQVQTGSLRVAHVSSKDQLANALTKLLPCSNFQIIKYKISLSCRGLS